MKKKKTLTSSNKMNIAASYIHHFNQCGNADASIKRTLKEFPSSRPKQILELKEFYYPDAIDKGVLKIVKKQEKERHHKQKEKTVSVDTAVSLTGFIPPWIS